MNELITITYSNERPVVSARELHEFLEVDTPYRIWFPRMCEYGFSENQDFNPYKNVRVQTEGDRQVNRMVDDALLSIDMAKEICMIQRTEKGKQARQYFVRLEADWNSPEKVMARALDIAHRELNALKAKNSELTTQNTIMQPKAEYFDALVDRNLLTSFRQTAKELGTKERAFLQFLMDHKYIYRDKGGKLMPYTAKNDGLFEVKECYNDKSGWKGTQTLVTPKGRETFRMLCVGVE